MSGREDIGVKARRYLASGRLRVTLVADDRIAAKCRGSGDNVYSLGREEGIWYCSCPSRADCSHLRALRLVTLLQEPPLPARREASTGGAAVSPELLDGDR